MGEVLVVLGFYAITLSLPIFWIVGARQEPNGSFFYYAGWVAVGGAAAGLVVVVAGMLLEARFPKLDLNNSLFTPIVVFLLFTPIIVTGVAASFHAVVSVGGSGHGKHTPNQAHGPN